MNTKSFLFIFSPLWMNFAAKHLFLFSITAFVLLCAVDMTDVSCFSHRNFYWQRTTGYLENVELCSMKDCSFEFIATCVSPCWDLFSGRILYPSASPPRELSDISSLSHFTMNSGTQEGVTWGGGSPTLLSWSRTKTLCNDSFSF